MQIIKHNDLHGQNKSFRNICKKTLLYKELNVYKEKS